MRQLFALIALVGASFALITPSWSQVSAPTTTTWYVDASTGNDSNTGLSWSQAFATLQKAIESASNGDAVWVAAGTYFPSKDSTGNVAPSDPRTLTFYITTDIEIYGGFNGTETMLEQRDWVANPTFLDGNIGDPFDALDNVYHVVYFEDVTGAARLDGFTIRNGFNNGPLNPHGAGILMSNADPVIAHCWFIDNALENPGIVGGGAMGILDTSNPYVVNCVFTNNTAIFGGAVYTENSNPNFVNCTSYQNQAEVAGFLYLESGTASVTNGIHWEDVTSVSFYSSTGSGITVTYTITFDPVSGTGNFSPTTGPDFVDAANLDFHLLSYSPAVDAGTNANAPTDDYDGNSRPCDGNGDTNFDTDMGAYELQVNCPGGPMAVCKDTTLYLSSTGSVSVNADIFDGGSTGTPPLTFTVNGSPTVSFDCTDLGTQSVQLIVTDGNGQTDSCSATVTILDTVAPTATCPTSTLVGNVDENGQFFLSVLTAGVGSSDNCSLQSLTISDSLFTCADIGSHTLVVTAIDSSGNTSTCQFQMDLYDVTAPNAYCQDVTVSLDTNGQASISPADIDNGSTDNCGIASMTLSDSTFTCSDLGESIYVTLTVTDPSGNQDSCILAQVLVIDTIPPTALCQNTTVALDPYGQAPFTAAQIDNGSYDNCAIMDMYPFTNSFNCLDIGTDTVVLTVIDSFYNISYCVALVTVIDTIPPTALCNDATIALDANGQVVLSQNDVASNSYDNCGIVDVLFSQATFTCADIGTHSVSVTLIDSSANKNTCIAQVTVVDNTAPTAACQDITVALDTNGQASITAADIDAGSTDNCSVSLSANPTAFTCNDLGTQTVVLTATDPSGNTDTCHAQVTVVDNIAPTALCQNITVALDANGQASITAADIDAGSTDNCSVSLSANPTAFTCNDLGTQTVVLTATDPSGNTDTCHAQVSVLDNIAPMANCQNVVISLDANGQATITTTQINYNSSDNCSLSLSANPTSFTCNDLGTQTVVLTATDPAGNTDTCHAQVTVLDNMPPTATCQDITATLDANGQVSITPTLIDNGSTDNCAISTMFTIPNAFHCNYIGTNTVTLTVVDSVGNTNTCQAQVTVVDTIPPTMVCQDATIALDTAGQAVLTQNDIVSSVSDNCTLAGVSFTPQTLTCALPGTVTVQVTAFDTENNLSTCTAQVTLIDTIAPTAICQNITVALGSNGLVMVTLNDLAPASYDNCSIESYILSETSFTCADIGTNSVTVTVIDGTGNQNSCTAQVTVVDNSAPTASCQDISVALDANGQASITAADIDAGSTDNCSVSLSANPTSFTCNDLGTQTVVLTVTDPSGNTDTCHAQVTVVDNIAPTALCQNISMALDANGQASITAADIDAGSTDNCSVSLSANPTAFTCNDLGTQTVVLTATDPSGNSDNCTAQVTIADITPPTALCNDATIALDANGQAVLSQNDVASDSYDNCNIADITFSQATFTCADIGTNSVTVTVIDGTGNQNSCTAQVTVVDNMPPTASCQDITVALGANGQASITAADIDAGSTDNCAVSLAASPIAFTCNDLGTQTVVLTVTDPSGNTDTCHAQVTVVDNIAPTALCQNISVALDANGQASITPADIDAGSTDNCSVSLSASPTTFTCNDLGTQAVVLTATDPSGNADNCTAQVTVADITPPTALCNDATIALDANGQAVLSQNDVASDSYDNCNIADITFSQATFTCADIGTNSVTVTVIDGTGNQNSCTAQVTVVDNTAPTAACQDITVALGANGQASITPADIDAGSTDNCSVSLSASPTAFTCNDLGTQTVVLTATDPSGNTDTCHAQVTVVDNIAPTALCQNISVALDANGQASITPADIDAGSTDNCSVSLSASPTTFTCNDLGTQTVVLTATDPSGNSDNCTAQVTVADITPPTALCNDATIALDANGQAVLSQNDVASDSYDNCNIADITFSQATFTCADIGTHSVTVTVIDGTGNQSTCTALVTVVDNIAPQMFCNTSVSLSLDAQGIAVLTPAMIDLGTTDNCGTVSFALSQDTFTCADLLQPLTVTMIATDGSGNSNTCQASILLSDLLPPVVTCTTDTVLVPLDASGIATVSAAQIASTIEDNCGLGSVGVSPSNFGCNDLGLHTVTVTATDASNNPNSCTATVRVIDSLAPTAQCAQLTVYLDENGEAFVAPEELDANSTDNCSYTYSSDLVPLTCDQVNTVVTADLVISDPAGNIGQCTAEITVRDTTAPVATCQDVTLGIDASGTAVLDSAAIAGQSSDNCSIASIQLSASSFTCADLGSHTVEALVTDVAGNAATCTAMVTVQDVMPPALSCPNDTVVVALDPQCACVPTITPQVLGASAADNCGMDSLWVAFAQAPVDCDDKGFHLAIITAEDVQGLTTKCEVTVEVRDLTPPVAQCQDLTVMLDENGLASISASMLDDGSTNMCNDEMAFAASVTSFDCSQLGQNVPVAVVVTDLDNGLSDTCTAHVKVLDTHAPQILGLTQSTLYVDTNGLAVPDPNVLGIQWSDNCNAGHFTFLPDTFTCAAVNTPQSLLIVLSDDLGLADTAMVTITVQDTVPPQLFCSNATVWLDSTGFAMLKVESLLNTFDNCDQLTWPQDTLYFDCSQAGTDTVLTLTATDQSGNQTTCTPIVSVRDSIAPAIACTTDTVTLVIDSAFAQTGQFWPVPGNQPWVDVWDNCYHITLDTIETELDSLGALCDEALFNQPHQITIRISDGTQTASCMLSAIVVDTIAPYFACDTIQVQLNGPTDTAFISDPTLFSQASMPAWDNCGVAELSAAQSAFPYDPQPVSVTVTVSDAAGNHYTCTSHVVTLLPNVAGDARQLAGTFRLSPNPTSGTLSLEWALPVAAPLEMRLTDLSGRTIERIELPEVLHGRQTFDWHHLPEGVYLIMITDGKRVHTDRIVILP